MGFEDTLQKFLKKNTTLAVVPETAIVKKAKRVGIDITTLDEKDILYAVEQYQIQAELF